MYELSRIVRFSLDLSRAPAPGSGDGPAGDDAASNPGLRHNTYAGWPSMRGIGVYYELDVHCTADADAVTGYAINIADIDAAVRDHAIPHLQGIVLDDPARDPFTALREMYSRVDAALGGAMTTLRWRLTPYYCLTLEASAMDRVVISQQFDFAAAHRLNSPELSADENRAVFGHCNNANGHGHNYRLQVDASTDLDTPADTRLHLAMLERIVDEYVVKRFDHTHLNLDTEEFATLNPSVEHIARTCHALLADAIANAGGRLERVTVWETDRTSCTYPAPQTSN